jgi:hypothetical protein
MFGDGCFLYLISEQLRPVGGLASLVGPLVGGVWRLSDASNRLEDRLE